MKKVLKNTVVFIIILVALGMLILLYNLLGNNSINLKEITSSEKEEILKMLNLNNSDNNIELEKLESPKTYKDKYYIIYFSTDLDDKDVLNNKTNNLYREFIKIKEEDKIVKYRCTISNMGKSLKTFEQIVDKYND